MSAFVCSDLHIQTIAHDVGAYFEIDIQALADKLKAINIDSVNYRYNEKTRKTKCKGKPQQNLSLNDIAKLINSWCYQSCEDNSIDYKAYSLMLETWQKENQTDSSLGEFWSI